MDLSTFFQKFDQFADAPDAVAKMRELVLHLAFSGKLLPTAEPWPLRPLKSLAVKIGSGATPAGGRESYFTEGIPLIRSMNVHFAGFEPKGLVFLSDEQAKQLANVTVQLCDVLLNITGASIGRVTTAPSEMAGARVNQHVAIIRPIKELDAQFLAKFLASPAIQRMIDDVQVGATREALTKGMIEQFEIPLPPLTEQKRIVAKVDELMALCDRLEAQQQERETRHAALARASLARFAEAPTPANLDFLFHSSFSIPPSDLRKSILTLAVQGKLIPQDYNEGSGDEVLSALRERNQKQEENPSSESIAEDSLPFSIPVSWAFARLGEIYESSFYGPRFGKEEYVKEGGIPTIRTTDMTPGGQIILRDPPCVKIDDPKKMALYAVRPNDLLVTRSGTIGTMAVFKGDYVAIPSAYLIRFRFPPEVTADFYYLFLGSPYGNDLLGLSLRSIGVPNVNATSISKFVAPLPPLAEQRRIVAKVDQLMALVDALETQLAASRATAANLLSALVSELTSRPATEPESELMAAEDQAPYHA
jgi:type I restriction enzyme, S subunit